MPVGFVRCCRGMIATEFLAVLFFHHRPNLCSCPTPATRKSPEWENERELINPFCKREEGREKGEKKKRERKRFVVLTRHSIIN
jgi:hypothetical protein